MTQTFSHLNTEPVINEKQTDFTVTELSNLIDGLLKVTDKENNNNKQTVEVKSMGTIIKSPFFTLMQDI